MGTALKVFFAIIPVCWIAMFIQGHRMFYLFRKKHPEIARREIACAFEPYAHPEKFFFFFRKDNRALLKSDEEVWRLRKQVKILMIISFGLPFSIIFAGVVYVAFNAIGDLWLYK